MLIHYLLFSEGNGKTLAVKLETTKKPAKPLTDYPNHPQTIHKSATNQSDHKTFDTSSMEYNNRFTFWKGLLKRYIFLYHLTKPSLLYCEIQTVFHPIHN